MQETLRACNADGKEKPCTALCRRVIGSVWAGLIPRNYAVVMTQRRGPIIARNPPGEKKPATSGRVLRVFFRQTIGGAASCLAGFAKPHDVAC